MQKPNPIAKWNQQRDLWETNQQDLISGHSAVYSETWPAWGMTRAGVAYQLPPSEPRTTVTAYSYSPTAHKLLPTPQAVEGKNGAAVDPARRRARGYQVMLKDIAAYEMGPRLLPTPCAQPSGNSPEEHLAKKPGRRAVTDLGILVEHDLMDSGGLLPTPRATLGGSYTETLALLPTPTANAAKQAAGDRGAKDDHNLWAVVNRPEFGAYGPAITRWERATGRPAPPPTDTSRTGRPRLSSRFVEWMMGLPEGWVTGVGLSRSLELRALGNGVVPLQAAIALICLLNTADNDS